MNYRFATISDIDLLVQQRLSFIEVEKDSDSYSLLRDNCYSYFEKAFAENTCDVILAEDKGRFIGTGIAFYYDSVPSAGNITGKNAYVTSMFVESEYRRNGIGKTMLNKLVEAAKARGCEKVMLNASDMGRLMYEKIGFEDIYNGMILDIGK